MLLYTLPTRTIGLKFLGTIDIVESQKLETLRTGITSWYIKLSQSHVDSIFYSWNFNHILLRNTRVLPNSVNEFADVF